MTNVIDKVLIIDHRALLTLVVCKKNRARRAVKNFLFYDFVKYLWIKTSHWETFIKTLEPYTEDTRLTERSEKSSNM